MQDSETSKSKKTEREKLEQKRHEQIIMAIIAVGILIFVAIEMNTPAQTIDDCWTQSCQDRFFERALSRY